eukprot:scaffold7206_cov57-Phaeocystis_antarctica.AAC.6
MTRPLESFLDFYVSPTTHLVRPARALALELPPYHPLGAPCTRALTTHTHLCTCTAALPPLPNSPEPIVRALTSARALSVIRAAGAFADNDARVETESETAGHASVCRP